MLKAVSEITLKEVARAAGVSLASASRALRGGEGISAGLRVRVMAAAERLGYQPNLAARALASRSRPVGIVVADPSDLLLVTIASAVAAALAERSVRSFVTWDPGGGPGIHAPDSRAVSGWVRVGARPTPTQNFATAIPDIGIADSPDDRRDIIDLGRIYGLALACRYLATQGHHRIAVLAAPDMFEADRFVAALGEASVALEPVGVGLPGVRTALKQMGQGHWRPTAVLCDSDVAALAAVQGCAAEGMAVPRQVSIVGFGDVPFARYSVPTLTTIRVCVERIGALAAKAMMDRDSLRNAPLSPPAKLVVRQSSGPAP